MMKKIRFRKKKRFNEFNDKFSIIIKRDLHKCIIQDITFNRLVFYDIYHICKDLIEQGYKNLIWFEMDKKQNIIEYEVDLMKRYKSSEYLMKVIHIIKK